MRTMPRTIAMGWALGCLAAVLLAVPAQAQWTWTPQTGRWINLDRLPKETAELQYEFARSLYLEGQYAKALRETDKFDSFYGDSEYADDNQFLRGEIRMAQGKNRDAARAFQEVVANYPDSDLFDDVIAKQYEIGDRFFAQGEARADDRWRLFKNRPYRRAAEVYGMVVQNQPFTNAAAEAQYKIGLCNFAQDKYIEAAYDYRRVVEEYGGSDWVDEASYGLAQCYYKESHPPQYDQAPSELTIEAVNAFVRRFPADPRVTELEAQKAEMLERIATQRLMTAQYYEKRRKFDAARIYYNVVVNQFPDTDAAAQARDWLARNPAGAPAPVAEG